MQIHGIAVNAHVRREIPDPSKGEDIRELVNFEILTSDKLKQVAVYRREPEDCPYNRGNWMIDLFFFDDDIVCIKLPLDTPEDIVKAYIKPLNDRLDEIDAQHAVKH